MPSTFTDSLGLELQANGENLNTWGERNNGVISLIEEAVSGYVAVTIAGDTTLTITDGVASSGATDQARNAIIKLTGVPGVAFNLTLPEVEKSWVIWNATDAIATIRTATATTTVALGVDQLVAVVADGLGNVVQFTPLITDAGVVLFDQIENASGVTVSATQWGYLGALDQAVSTTDDVVFETIDVTGAATLTGLDYPTVDGSAGQYVTTDGAGTLSFGTPAGAGDVLASANLSDLADIPTARDNLGLGTAALSDATDFADRSWQTKTTAYTAISGDRIVADTSGGAFTVTLPATPASGDEVWFADPGLNWATVANLTVSGNGNNIDGAATFAADVDEGHFIAIYDGTSWVVRFAGGTA